MNWLDILILVILGVGVFTGLKNGIIKMAFSLAGLIVGIILAGRYYPLVAEWLSFIPEGTLADGLAFVLILIAVTTIASVLAAVLKQVTSAVMLGWVNHLGGGAFGLIMGAVSAAAMLTMAIKVPFFSDVVAASGFANILLDKFPAVLALLPAEFDAVRSFFE